MDYCGTLFCVRAQTRSLVPYKCTLNTYMNACVLDVERRVKKRQQEKHWNQLLIGRALQWDWWAWHGLLWIGLCLGYTWLRVFIYVSLLVCSSVAVCSVCVLCSMSSIQPQLNAAHVQRYLWFVITIIIPLIMLCDVLCALRVCSHIDIVNLLSDWETERVKRTSL